MSEQPNKQSIWDKLKSKNINRSSVIAALILVIALAVIVSVTVISNRSKKKTETPTDTDKAPVTDTTAPTPDEPIDTTPPADTEAPTPQQPSGGGSSQVGNKLPSFILPVSGSLSKKHDPTMQVYSSTLNDYRCHIGVDIVTAENAPVYAAADGTVSKIWKDPMMGYSVAVKHSGDCYTIYQNLSDTLPDGIETGSAVRSGQLIASVGDSAMIELADEPHLHFEMTVSDLGVDPLEYFNEKALESLSIDASHGE